MSDRAVPHQSIGETSAAADIFGGLDLAEYWRIVMKRRFVIAGLFVAAVALGVAITLLTTPIYVASATLQIDREAARVLDVEEVSPSESMIEGEEFFRTQYGLLRSRTLAERVIDTLGLASSDAFLKQMEITPPDAEDGVAVQAERRRELVLKTVQDNLGVGPVRGSRLVTLTFASPDANLSARVVNAFAENFIQSNLDRKFESSSYARQFLEERIAQTKTKLEEAERLLVAYATTQQIINVAEATTPGGEAQSLATNNLVSINTALSAARTARVEAEAEWNSARSTGLLNLPEVLSNQAIQRLAEQRATAQGEYQQKLRIYKPDFPEMVQLKANIDELTSQINTIAGGIRNSIRGQYEVAVNQERVLQSQVDGLKSDVLDLRDRSIQYNILQREVDTSRILYEGLLQRYKEVGVTGGVTANNVSIVDTAIAPNRPAKPRLLLNLLLAAAVGAALGLAAAFLIELFDESLSTPESVETKLGVPILGVVPLLQKNETPASALADMRSGFAEAYYSLRTALQFSTPNGAPTTILVTSSRPGEGKSTTAHAIAQNLARVGKTVLLIDGDLRKPSMHRVVGVANDKGMSNLLSGSHEMAGILHATKTEGLSFIPSGPIPPSPAELWGSDRFKMLLVEATKDFDHVVIDGPPVLGFADAPVQATAVDGVVFVMESQGAKRAQVRGALRRVTAGGARLLGAVLTKFDARSAQYGGYDYAYDYNYGAEAGTEGKGKSKGKGRG